MSKILTHKVKKNYIDASRYIHSRREQTKSVGRDIRAGTSTAPAPLTKAVTLRAASNKAHAKRVPSMPKLPWTCG
jgi:hypothetical protein